MLDNCSICRKYLKDIGEQELGFCIKCSDGVSEVEKSFKTERTIEIQYFDLGDCPYQINEFIKKEKIEYSEILGISHSGNNVIMTYITDESKN